MQVLCNFMKMLTRACYEAFGHHGGTKRVPRRRNENGATTTYPKMMPRQHIGSGSTRRYRCKRRRADVRNMLEMVGCSRLPGSHGTAAWQTRNMQRPLSDTVQTRASHTTHKHSFTGGRLGFIPLKCAFRGGSSCRGK